MLIVVVQLHKWVSIFVNTNDLNRSQNQTKMNVQLRWGQMKLHRQYVSSLHLIVTSKVSNWVSCNEHWTLVKVWSIVWLWCQCLVWWAYREPFVMKPRISLIGGWISDINSWNDLTKHWRVWNNFTYTSFVVYLVSVWTRFNTPWALTFSCKKLDENITFLLIHLPITLMICGLFE